MKTLSTLPPRWQRLLSSVLLLPAIAAAGFAQPVGAGNGGPNATQSDLAAVRTRREIARNHARGNNVAQTVSVLSEYNRAASGTAAWHLETAQKLIQLAEDLGRDAMPRPALAQTALQHAVRAGQLATTPETALGAKLLAGYIHERHLADRENALACFRDAAQLAPQSAAAREAYERMRRADETIRQRRSQGGGR
ncbi:MAG: hypothetical protein FJ399_10250 [Verrucomicrobia bacterium]|nr:hypothetical protein [Verrucomicrobiota bacterium]